MTESRSLLRDLSPARQHVSTARIGDPAAWGVGGYKQFLYWLCLRPGGRGLTVEWLTEGWLGFRRRERVWFERHGRPGSDPART